jgi:hypothetical protein
METIMQKLRLTPEWRLILGLALVKLMLHFFTNTNYGLHRDAFLYLALGDHLDFGYMAVPPLIALFAKITMTVFGDSVFAIRLFPALIGVASVVIVGMIVRLLGGRMWAILLACTAFIVSPAFLRSNTLFQPVSFNQFFWLLAIYFAIKLVQTKNPKFWLHIGVVCGLAFLNKYSLASMRRPTGIRKVRRDPQTLRTFPSYFLLASPGTGITPSCCIIVRSSASPQCSTAMPSL